MLPARMAREPSSLMNGLARLGGPKPETPSLETVESLLYVFSNEGYLDMDLSASTPLFTMTEPFIGTASFAGLVGHVALARVAVGR